MYKYCEPPKHKVPQLVFCESCRQYKPWSTFYMGLQSEGRLMAVCPACKKHFEQLDKEAKTNLSV